LLSRSLELTVELLEFGLPMVIALNMWDEAERKGLKIYPEKLEKMLLEDFLNHTICQPWAEMVERYIWFGFGDED
jgi:hypothetical protein